MAGLLTYFLPERLPIAGWRTVAEYVPGYRKITAAGTVQDSHLIPYYPLIWLNKQNHNLNKYIGKISFMDI
jgi:hypothetical protein